MSYHSGVNEKSAVIKLSSLGELDQQLQTLAGVAAVDGVGGEGNGFADAIGVVLRLPARRRRSAGQHRDGGSARHQEWRE